MNAIHLDPVGGIAGDMLLAALIDLGADADDLRHRLGRLGLTGYTIEAVEEMRRGLRGRRVVIEVDEASQPHRKLADIRAIIDSGNLPPRAAQRATEIFEALARAEAYVHGSEIDRVHFHEVGAVDSILDIVGVSLALELLDIDTITAGEVPLGTGTTSSAHGVIPLPAPATARLLEGWPVRFTGLRRELVTPTGAAVLAALASPGPPAGPARLARTGVGYGTRRDEDGPPNMVRALLLVPGAGAGAVDVVTATLDDASPEWIGFLMERLLAAGARDVHTQPVQMKKNRPGIQVTALVQVGDAERIASEFFTNSTTLGLRIRREERRELERRVETVETPVGPMRVKVASRPGGATTVAPEFEDCRRAATEHGLPLPEVYRIVEAAWRDRTPRT